MYDDITVWSCFFEDIEEQEQTELQQCNLKDGESYV